MGFSKQKDRVLLALSEGVKLHEFMRERDAPSKSMLEEWRDNDPEFEVAYKQAVEAGRVKRGEPAPAPAKPKPAPTVTDEDGREHVIPRSTALLREAAAPQQLARPHSGIEPDEADPRVFKDEPLPALVEAPAPVAPVAEVAAPSADTIFRDKMLARRQAGESSGDLLKVSGMSHAKLARWREQYPEFRQAWDACRKTSHATTTKPTVGAVSAAEIASEFEQLRDQVQQLSRDNERLTEETHRWSEAEKQEKERHQGEIDQLTRQVADYQEYQAEQKRLTRELDVALFGEENAAQQASLCDLISPARKLRETLVHHINRTEERNERDTWQAELVEHLQAGDIDVSDYLLGLRLPDLTTAREHLARRIEARRTEKGAQVLAQTEAAVAMQLKAVPTPQHPGLLLADLLRRAGTPRADFAAALGIGLSTLNTLLAGNTCLSMAVCAKLEKLHWGTAEAWCRRQIDFDNHREAQPVAA